SLPIPSSASASRTASNYQPRHGRSPPRAGLFLPLASVSFGGLTPSSHDRLFGTDAANLASRFPTDSFQATKLLLGIPCDGASVAKARHSSKPRHGSIRLAIQSRFDDGQSRSADVAAHPQPTS
ncbi:unnamed protein product, partial [Tilletia caries]